MNWRQYIERKYQLRQSDKYISIPKFHPPASKEKIQTLEKSFGLPLPQPLKDLLGQTDGVTELIELDGRMLENMWLIWSTDEIEKENKLLRTETMRTTYQRTFSDLLFFAGAGADGILFAFMVGKDSPANIYVWHPIENIVSEIASSLEVFIGQWIHGEMIV